MRYERWATWPTTSGLSMAIQRQTVRCMLLGMSSGTGGHQARPPVFVACPSCLSQFPDDTNRCSHCGASFEQHEVSELSAIARQVTYWAWQYGSRFRNELVETNRVETRYSLWLDEPLTY